MEVIQMVKPNKTKQRPSKEKLSDMDVFFYSVGLPYRGKCTVLLKLDTHKSGKPKPVELLSTKALHE